MSTCLVPGCDADQTSYGVCLRHRDDDLRQEQFWDRGVCEGLLWAWGATGREIAEILPRPEPVSRTYTPPAGALDWHPDGTAYGRAALRSIVERFYAQAGDGRNNALAGAAWAVGRLVAGGELAHEAGMRALEEAAASVDLPHSEARDVIRMQVRKAAARPKAAPADPAPAPSRFRIPIRRQPLRAAWGRR